MRLAGDYGPVSIYYIKICKISGLADNFMGFQGAATGKPFILHGSPAFIVGIYT